MNNYVFSPQIELLNFSVFLCLFVRLFLIERLGSKPCLWLHSLTVMNGCKCWPTVNNQTSALSDWCKQTTENNKQLWTFGDFWWKHEQKTWLEQCLLHFWNWLERKNCEVFSRIFYESVSYDWTEATGVLLSPELILSACANMQASKWHQFLMDANFVIRGFTWWFAQTTTYPMIIRI